MLKLVIVTVGLGLGLIAGSASAVGTSRADWRLDWVNCGPETCTARLVSTHGDIDEVAALTADAAAERAQLKLMYLNGTSSAGDLGNG